MKRLLLAALMIGAAAPAFANNEAGMAYLQSVESDVGDFVRKWQAAHPQVIPASAQSAPHAIPAWCAKAKPSTDASHAYVEQVCR